MSKQKQFAITADVDQVEKWRNFINQSAQQGETQGETLNRIFSVAADRAQSDTLKDANINADALDASLTNIKSMFINVIQQQSEILEQKDNDFQKLKEAKNKQEADLISKIKSIEEECNKLKNTAETENAAAKQAREAAALSQKQADTSAALVSEKDKTILSLTDQLQTVGSKVDQYDNLAEAKRQADLKINELNQQIMQIKRDADTATREQKAATQHQLNDVKKDAALSQEKAVNSAIKKSNEKIYELELQLADALNTIKTLKSENNHAILNAQKDAALAQKDAVSSAVRDAERENAKLNAKIELLKEQNDDLRSQLKQLEQQ